MSSNSPEEVLRAVSADFKINGITHAKAAEKLGIKNKQTLSNLLSSKKYMSKVQAIRFHDAFGYSVDYLTSGVGGLYDDYPYGVRLAFNKNTKSYIVIDDSQKGDIDLIMYWFHEVFSRQNNKDGLEIWSEIFQFAQAKSIVSNSLRCYKFDNYNQEFESKLYELHSQLVEQIEDRINHIQADS